MLAEWEHQSMVQLTWPHEGTDWAPILDEITAIYENMASEIRKREPLLIVDSIPHNDTWARDHGFITVEEDSVLFLLDFKFNGWGEKFEAALDNEINKHLYEQGLVKGTYEDHLDFVLEGGSIESDGKGTVFTTSQCLLAPNRNQPLSKEGIEDYLKKVLCAERIVWLDYGNLIGDDTDGHIDTIVRIAPNYTILYVKCDDNKDEQFEDFDALEKQLQVLRTKEGKPYRLLPLPMPKAMYDDGDRLPATYANFLIINGAVLVPTYNQPELDKKALEIIQEAFPDREIIGIDAQVAVRQHGSLHCLTMQFPAE